MPREADAGLGNVTHDHIVGETDSQNGLLGLLHAQENIRALQRYLRRALEKISQLMALTEERLQLLAVATARRDT